MKLSTIFFIVLSIILMIAIGYGVTVTYISISLNNQVTVLKHEKNLIMQDLNTMRNEYVEKQKIIEDQTVLLQKVKNASSFKEYIAVWKELNK